MNRASVVIDKPIFVGCCILDLSKLQMLQSHYGVVEPNLKNKYALFYSDSDSLISNFKHTNLHEWFYNKSNDFDLSSMDNY